jgi:hypothetical protein
MKNAIFSFAALLVFGLLLSSCKKDPVFEEQLVGSWVSNKVTYGQTDGTLLYKFDIHLESSKEFDLTETTPIGSVIRTGTWSSNEDTQEVTLNFEDGSPTLKYDIVTITDALMTAETILNGTRFTIEFKK